MGTKPKVVIVGGGYGGVASAARLQRQLGVDGAHVTLVSTSRYMLTTPMLSLSASGMINPQHALFPLTNLLKSTEVLIGEATSLDSRNRVLVVRTDAEQPRTLQWDRIILAPGCVTKFSSEPGPAELSIGTKNFHDANAIRDHVLAQLALADAATDHMERLARLTFVVVGAGFSGTEFTAQMQAASRRAIAHYPSLNPNDLRWVLIHRSHAVMPGLTRTLAHSAVRLIRQRGIDVRLDTTIVAASPGAIRLSTGECLQTETLIWSAGTRPRPWISDTGLPTESSGRIAVNSFLEVAEHPNVYAVGDAACVPDPYHPGGSAPQTATHAKAQGVTAADNVAASLGRGVAQPHRHRDRSLVVNLGARQGLGLVGAIPLRGTAGWLAAFCHRLGALPKGPQRRRIAIEWLKNSNAKDCLLTASAAEFTRSAAAALVNLDGVGWGPNGADSVQ